MILLKKIELVKEIELIVFSLGVWNSGNVSVSFLNTLPKNILNVSAFWQLSLMVLLPSFRSGMVREYSSLLDAYLKNALGLVFTSLERGFSYSAMAFLHVRFD